MVHHLRDDQCRIPEQLLQFDHLPDPGHLQHLVTWSRSQEQHLGQLPVKLAPHQAHATNLVGKISLILKRLWWQTYFLFR